MIVLLFVMLLCNIMVFSVGNENKERQIFIEKPTYYGHFILIFVIVENDKIVDSHSFWMKYNKKGLKKIINANIMSYANNKFSYTDDGNIYIYMYKDVCYTTDNFNNYLNDMFKANEGANFLNRILHSKEVFIKVCPDFFEMTNEERLEYFSNQVGQ